MPNCASRKPPAFSPSIPAIWNLPRPMDVSANFAILVPSIFSRRLPNPPSSASTRAYRPSSPENASAGTARRNHGPSTAPIWKPEKKLSAYSSTVFIRPVPCIMPIRWPPPATLNRPSPMPAFMLFSRLKLSTAISPSVFCTFPIQAGANFARNMPPVKPTAKRLASSIGSRLALPLRK